MRVTVLLSVSLMISVFCVAQKPTEQKIETRVIVREGSGSSGLSTAKPLVIIDGKSGGDLQSLSPDKIMSMDVLKGESATKLYGADGKNGVIIITTKSDSSLDTVIPGNKKVERILTVNTIRKRDGVGDTTIIRSDSMTVKVDGNQIEINGVPLMGGESRILKGFSLPDLEGMIWDNKPAPKIGLSVQDTEEGTGALVTAVVSSGAASKSGIQSNDRIISIDENPIRDVDGLKRAIQQTKDKRSVMVKLIRGKKEMNLELVYPRELKRAEL